MKVNVKECLVVMIVGLLIVDVSIRGENDRAPSDRPSHFSPPSPCAHCLPCLSLILPPPRPARLSCIFSTVSHHATIPPYRQPRLQLPHPSNNLSLESLGRNSPPNLPEIRQSPLIVEPVPLETQDRVLGIHARHAAQLLGDLDLFRRKALQSLGQVGSVDVGRLLCCCRSNGCGWLDFDAVSDKRTGLGVVCGVGQERVDDQGVGKNLAWPAFFGGANYQYLFSQTVARWSSYEASYQFKSCNDTVTEVDG